MVQSPQPPEQPIDDSSQASSPASSQPAHVTPDQARSESETVPEMGGGLPVIGYWAKRTLSPQGPKLWQTLLHHSACLSCAWGTSGQKGGFTNEEGEKVQRCMKSVEAITAEIQPGLDRHFFDQRRLSELQQLTSMECDRLGRLSFPVIHRAGSDRYERISWEEIYQLAEASFRKSPERVASYSSGRSSNEAAFMLQLMLRSMGSNNLADCSDLCHAPSTTALKETFGSNTSMVSLEGVKEADCVVLIGANSPYNHPRFMNELIKLRDRGGRVIIVNPIVEVGLLKFGSPAFPLTSLLTGSEIASLYLQLIPGSDVALFVGIQKSLLEQNLAKLEFVKAHAENWEAVVQQAEQTSWEAIEQTCGVSRQEISAAAQIIGTSKGVIFTWAMGATQHDNGVDNVYSIANTAILSGNVGKKGSGTMPIRGHSNVQGFGSMGVTAHLKPELQKSIETLMGKPMSNVQGYDTRRLIEAADASKVDTLLCLGGNLYAAQPDLTQAKRALGKVETIFYLATKPNLGHFHGLAQQNTIVIPVLNRFETPHKTTVESGNNFVRLNDEGQTHLKEADLIAEVDFLAELASRLLGDDPVNWKQLHDTQYVRQLIAKTIPGYEKIAEIDRTREEFTIGGRIFNEPKFKTPSGKAQMTPTPLPKLSLPQPQDFGLAPNASAIVVALITARSYAQHNTVVYKSGDQYRGMPHRNCVLMHPDDAKLAKLQEHDRVTVQGDAGKLENVEVIYGSVRPGSALMFYPEVNIIFKAKIDERSGTPAYKRVPAVIYA